MGYSWNGILLGYEQDNNQISLDSPSGAMFDMAGESPNYQRVGSPRKTRRLMMGIYEK